MFAVFENIHSFNFVKENTQNCFAHNSATKYRSQDILYSRRTAEYPPSHHVKTIAVAFYKLSDKAKNNVEFHQFGKITQFWTCCVHPRLCLKAET